MQYSQFYCSYWSSLSVFSENLIIYVWPCKSFPIEKPKPSLFSLLLNSSLMEFLNELFNQTVLSICIQLWVTYSVHSFEIPFWLRWVWLFFVLVVLVTIWSLFNCRLLLSDSLVCAQWKQPGPVCCFNVVFLLFSFCVVHFKLPTRRSCHIVLQSLFVEVNNLAVIVLKYHVTVEISLFNWSILFSSGERNFEGSIV